MNKKVIRFGIPAAIVAVVLVLILARAGGPLTLLKPDPAFRDYINAYTSGVISVEAAIKIRLTHPFADSLMIGKKADPSLFGFSPSLAGDVYWSDSRTIEFRPEGAMKPNTTYTCTFSLGGLKSVPERFKEFVFQFHTIKQNYEIRVNTPVIMNDNPSLYSVTGIISTADIADPARIREMIEAVYEDKQVEIFWLEPAGRNRYPFRVDSLVRSVQTATLVLSHDGKPIRVNKNGEQSVRIAGTAEFSVVEAQVVDEPDQCVVITFTDLLDPSMDFDGLVRIGNLRNLRFTVDGNRLKVYPGYSQSGEMTLVVESSVKNIDGKSLGTLYSQSIGFESLKPAVRMVGEGTVLPSTNGLLFPFEAVNLHTVDVMIQKIYEKNVPQFLQVNDLGGSDEMYRVATTVYDKRVDLRQTTSNVADFGQWNRYALDLSKLISPERGAIYRVILSFKKEYSTYPCDDTPEDAESSLVPVDEKEEEEAGGGDWSYMGDYEDDWYGYYDYDWDERNNPCSKSYYYYRSVSRNILSSDIGIIAKAGTDGELICFTTDIITALPLKGLQVQVLDYQLQVLAEGITDEDGKWVIPLRRKPFLIIAKRGEERGYLKLLDGNALSMSLFDVDGEKVRRGIKGFLYAERGVWRPGDTLFIHFILEDKQKQLPQDVPVLFELSDPQGNIIRRKVANASVRGIYEFHTTTDESAITGNYLGRVMIGNLVFSRYFKVETIKPNRLKIELRFPGDRITAGQEGTGTLEARWLHGALAPGLKASVSMTMEKGKTQYQGFEGYQFDDPMASFYTETSEVFEGNLDQAGRCVIDPGIELEENAPGVLRATFSTKVFEPGGDFSINTTTVPYYPFNSYAGLWVPRGTGWWDMLESGRRHTFKVANVTLEGKSISSARLKVEVYKIDWRWWWQNTERGLPYFLSNTQAVPVHKTEVTISGGRGQFTWGVGEKDWGRYLIRVTDPRSGHATGKVVYMDYPGWGRRSGQMREGASMLTISTDKGRYQTGEKVVVTIPSSPLGRALVSIETGTKVLRTEWMPTDSGTTRFDFTVTPEMAPNVYVHITLLQPHRQTINDMPIRMYGVVPVLVEDPGTFLKPVITTAATWESESEVSISVHEQSGRPMAYTLAVVDDGLLDLTGFKTPDPWKYFYGKEALGVKSWDLFSEVIGAMAGGFERLLSIGGGDTRINYDKQKTRRFAPVVRSFGPFFLEGGKRGTHRFTMPQYVGSVRVMVVAAHEGAYGNTEKTVTVKSPLMVLGTLPRVAGPGEEIHLPVSVFAMEKEIKNVQVKITPGGLFETMDASAKNLTFNQTGDQLVNFRLKVKNQTGPASVEIVAASRGRTARHTIHLEVRNPNPPETAVIEATLQPGEQWNGELAFTGITGTNRAEIELSAIPPLNLAERLDYLITYPHGCLEQIISSAFPQLMIRDLIYLDKRSLLETDAHIRAALDRIIQYMAADGTLSYWPNGSYYNDWSQSYAGHFMIEAEKKGFVLPPGIKKRWLGTQKRIAGNWKASATYRQDDFIQAYRLYTMALAGEPEIGAMNRLRNTPNLSVQAKWRLAAAYLLAGKHKTGQNLVAGIPETVAPYHEYGYTFGTELRDKAMILETKLLMNETVSVGDAVKHIVTNLNSQQWYNTQTTAYALIALSGYYAKNKAAEGLDCHYQYNGKTVTVKTDRALFTNAIPGLESGGTKNIVVKNNSRSTLYAKIRMTGIPMPGTETPVSRKLIMTVEYLTLSGKKIDPAKITQGSDFMARITITNTSPDNIEELALTHIIPSGWQIHNTRLTGATDTRAGNQGQMNYQDIRDDRILTYFNLMAMKSKTFTIMLNATYAGRFYMPAIQCEAMYVKDVFARTKGQWVEIVK